MARPRFLSKLLLQFAAATLFVAPVAYLLLSRVPDIIDIPVTSDQMGWAAQLVPLSTAVHDGDRVTANLTVQLGTIDRLLRHQEIRILFATFGERLRLVGGELRVSTSCSYVTPPGARLADNQYVPFVSQGNCSAVLAPGPTRLELTVTFEGAERVAVWTWVPPPGLVDSPTDPAQGADSQHWWQTDWPTVTTPEGSLAFMRGRYVDRRDAVGPRRVELLNYVWQISDRAIWIWATLAMVLGLVMIGLAVFPWGAAPRDAAALVTRGGVSAFAFAAALGTLYAVLVPPFEAPDEPDHLLSYSIVAGDQRLPEQAAALARLGHLERIKFHVEEKFRPSDVDHPYAQAWGRHVHAEDVVTRNPTATALFSRLGRVLNGRAPSQVVLTARLVNTCLLALAVAGGTWLVGMAGARPFPQLALVPFLLVPTLPFFGMMMSESAILVAGYVLLSCCFVALFLDDPRGHLFGLAVGVAAGVTFASGRSSGPMIAVVGSALAARALLGSRGRATLAESVRQAAVFWGGIGVGVLVFWYLATPGYRGYLQQSLPAVLASGPISTWLQQPLWLLPWLIPAALVEVLCGVARRSISRARAAAALSVIALLPAVVAVLIVGVALVSLFVPFPHLETVETAFPPNVWSYVASVLTVAGTSVRFGTPDHLLVASFWSGFGWLDTLPPPFLTTTLVLFSGLAAIVLMIHLARGRDTRRIVWLSLMAAGWVAALALYAVVSYATRRNLHGRYLIGFYLSVLSVVWSSSMLVPVGRFRVWPMAGSLPALRPALFLLGSATVHVYCLQVILTRYF